MTKKIELPLRVGFKYGSIKDATDRIIVPAPQTGNESLFNQFNDDVEYIVNSINKNAELVAVIKKAIETLVIANESGLINDTIWTDNCLPETLLDLLENAIEDA